MCIILIGAFGLFLHEVLGSFWGLRCFVRTIFAPLFSVDFSDGFFGECMTDKSNLHFKCCNLLITLSLSQAINSYQLLLCFKI